jgi:hypothetical protein
LTSCGTKLVIEQSPAATPTTLINKSFCIARSSPAITNQRSEVRRRGGDPQAITRRDFAMRYAGHATKDSEPSSSCTRANVSRGHSANTG